MRRPPSALPEWKARAQPVNASPPLVRVEGLSKTYREGDAETPVLHEVELALARGETTSLAGVSGSGKSTLIELLAGLLLPDSGRVIFDGQCLGDLEDSTQAQLRATRIGLVLQADNLIPFLTARENVELAIELADGDRVAARAKELLSEVGLADRSEHLPRQMSGGQAQRASVAVALANDPDLLLADEVTGELDSRSAEQIMDVIAEAWSQRGLTVLFVTHSGELAARAQRRLRLVDGEVRGA